MTSRNLFFNLVKEDFKRRLWAFILASLVFFGTFGVAFTMLIQNWADNYKGNIYMTEAEITEHIASRVSEFVSFNPWLAIVACVGAIICGVSGFAFLHSKKQVDFYHSLPVKREFIFAVRFTTGVLIYVIPYAIGLLFAYLMTAVFGGMTTDVLWAGTVGFFTHLMGYILMYLVTILAMLLTGKLLIAFFGIAVLNAYAPLMYGFVEALKEVFFVTQYIDSMDIEDVLLATRWLSPLSYYWSLFMVDTMVDFWLNVLTFFVLAAALSVLCIWLYKKRMSEKCGTSMSFSVTEPIFRMLIAVPVGVLAGFLFFLIQNDYGQRMSAMVWMVFGCVLGAFLAHGIIESFYKGDVKKALSHKGQLAATIVLAILIPLTFYFDVFGYDSYLPKKNEIRSMAVANGEMRFSNSGYRNEEGYWMNATEYALAEMALTQIDAAYALAERLSEDVKENRVNYVGGSYYRGIPQEDNLPVHMTEIVLKYELKNGETVYRTYTYNYYAILDLVELLYHDMEFRQTTHPMFSLEKAGWKPTEIIFHSPTLETKWGFASGVEEIMEVYRQELLALTFREVQETAAVAHMEVSYTLQQSEKGPLEYDAVNMLIYPSMTRTLALLKEHGCDVTPLEDCRVNQIDVVFYSDVAYDYITTESWEGIYSSAQLEKYGVYVMDGNQVTVCLTDYEEIQECLKYLVAREYCNEYGPFPETETEYRANVEFKDTYKINDGENGQDPVYGSVYYGSDYRFLKGQIPEFLLERVEEALGSMKNEEK